MQTVSVRSLFEADPAAVLGTTVRVQGWIKTRRDSKAGLSFIHVSDGSHFDPLQVVAPAELPNYESEILAAGTGCSVVATGELVESQGKGQRVELRASSVEIVGFVDDPDTYPVSAKRHSFEYLRDVAHLRVRTNTFGAVARVRNFLAQAINRYFDQRGYLWVHTPIITASDCEGAGQIFRVSTLDAANPPRTADGAVDFSQDFFGAEAGLTVSGQLNVETYCCALSKVYTFGPTFRAENSNTSRHLAEFWMVEPEIAFADLSDVADLAEDFLRTLLDEALTGCARDLAFFSKFVEKGLDQRLRHVAGSRFRRLPYTEAVEILQKSGERFEFKVEWGADLQSEHERYLTEKHFKVPVIVTDYPKEIKAFYMRANDDGRTVAALDVLVPQVGEIIGGAQREERLDVLTRRMVESGLEPEEYGWYLDLRRYGTVPHAGFGLGFERLVQYATGMGNIRDVIPFPRTPKNARF